MSAPPARKGTRYVAPWNAADHTPEPRPVRAPDPDLEAFLAAAEDLLAEEES